MRKPIVFTRAQRNMQHLHFWCPSLANLGQQGIRLKLLVESRTSSNIKTIFWFSVEMFVKQSHHMDTAVML